MDDLQNISTDSRGLDEQAGKERFVPTRNELQQIAAFWMGVLISAAYQRAIGRDGPAVDMDVTGDRLRRLSQILSADAMATAFDEAECQFGFTHDEGDYMRLLLSRGGADPAIERCISARECVAPVAGAANGCDNRTLSSDVDSLGPLVGGGIAIGFVEEMAGRECELVPEYDVIRPELIGLIEYWETEIIDVDYFYFSYSLISDTEMRLQEFAARRINRIATFLTKEEVHAAIERARTEFSIDIPVSLWQLFSSGAQPDRRNDRRIRWPPTARADTANK